MRQKGKNTNRTAFRRGVMCLLAVAVLGSGLMIGGCGNDAQEESKEQVQEAEVTPTPEPTEDPAEVAKREEEAAKAELVKQEEEFKGNLVDAKKSYRKLKRKVDNVSLTEDQQWEFSYFSPILLYYNQVARKGFEKLSTEEVNLAQKGILEVKKAIEEWK